MRLSNSARTRQTWGLPKLLSKVSFSPSPHLPRVIIVSRRPVWHLWKLYRVIFEAENFLYFSCRIAVANEQLVADEKRMQRLLSEAEKRIGILECDAIAAVRPPVPRLACPFAHASSSATKFGPNFCG